MGKWQVTCSCGDNFDVEADSKEAAMQAMITKMTPDVITAHWAEKHASQPMPSQEQMFGMLQTINEM